MGTVDWNWWAGVVGVVGVGLAAQMSVYDLKIQ